MPSIPAIITSPEQRADFFVRHYWNNVNFADTNYIHHPDITEQAWADYCNILNHVPLTTSQKAIKATIIRSEVDRKVFDYITGLADKYPYDPNSPLRNEEYYIPALEVAIASPLLDETEKLGHGHGWNWQTRIVPACKRSTLSIQLHPVNKVHSIR